MKKYIFKGFLAAFIAATIFLSIITGAKAKSDTYPTTFRVYAIDRQHDLLILQDFNGYIWTWEGVEDWEPGDIASAIMDDNGTKNITDDSIMKLKYSGYDY